MNGDLYDEIITLEESREMADKAVVLLDGINRMIEDITQSSKDFNDMANPTVEGCTYCPYKFCCDRLWESGIFREILDRSFNIRGILKEVRTEGEYTSLTIITENMSVRRIDIQRLASPHFGGVGQIPVGTNLTLVELKRVSENQERILLEPTERTIIWGES